MQIETCWCILVEMIKYARSWLWPFCGQCLHELASWWPSYLESCDASLPSFLHAVIHCCDVMDLFHDNWSRLPVIELMLSIALIVSTTLPVDFLATLFDLWLAAWYNCIMPPVIRSCSGGECQSPGTKIQLNNDVCMKVNDARCTHEELGVFGASWLEESDRWYCSNCLHMISNEKKRTKFQNKQQSHLWKTCVACVSCTSVTHQPNMSLVRRDFTVCELSTLSNGPLEPTQYVPHSQPKQAPPSLLCQQQLPARLYWTLDLWAGTVDFGPLTMVFGCRWADIHDMVLVFVYVFTLCFYLL